MGAFDVYNNAVNGVTQQIIIPPTSEGCPDHDCKYWDRDKCVFAECRYTVPELVLLKMRKVCIICDSNSAEVSPRSGDYVCPSCKAGIRNAIRLAHSPGAD